MQIMTVANPPVGNQRDIKWADGFRGVAALFVVTSHLTLSYAPSLLNPAIAEGADPPWYNWPIVRVFAVGPPWVNVFFLLTGFVNAMGPIKKSRAGNIEASLLGLASSTFRRTSRLVLPCTIATVIAWTICQLHGFHLGTIGYSDWMRNTSPAPSNNIPQAIGSLFTEMWRTWANSDNIYDKNQWTMAHFLRASMLVFVALLGTIRATPKYRMLIIGALYVFYWETSDAMVGLSIFSGIFLAELSLVPAVVRFSQLKFIVAKALPIALLLLGLLLCSFPPDNADWVPWSRHLAELGPYILPRGANSHGFYPAIGSQLIILSIILSASLQRLLSSRFLLWLGQASFPIYLIHGPLLRSFLNMILYIGIEPTSIQSDAENPDAIDERLPVPPVGRFLYALPIFFLVLGIAAHFWTLRIEPWCGRLTKSMEDRICGRHAKEQHVSILPMQETSSGRLVI